MKHIPYLTLIVILFIYSRTNAQSYIRASAIQIQIPNMNNETKVSITANNFKWNGTGSNIYVGNLYPNTYQIMLLLGNRRMQTAIRLSSGALSTVFMDSNGVLVQKSLRNSNQNLLPDPRSIPYSYKMRVDDSWSKKPNAAANPYVDEITTVVNRNSKSYQDWIMNFNKLNFDKDRIKYLQNTLRFNIDYITAKQIIKSITFDSDKLEASKYIIPNLQDPIGRRNLVELFDFEKNKQAYLKIVERYQN